MTIRVTKKDIEEGHCGSCAMCPVAQAIRRATRRANVRVAMDDIRVDRARYRTPAKVRQFIRKFDGGDRVAPFGFRLTA